MVSGNLDYWPMFFKFTVAKNLSVEKMYVDYFFTKLIKIEV